MKVDLREIFGKVPIVHYSKARLPEALFEITQVARPNSKIWSKNKLIFVSWVSLGSPSKISSCVWPTYQMSPTRISPEKSWRFSTSRFVKNGENGSVCEYCKE